MKSYSLKRIAAIVASLVVALVGCSTATKSATTNIPGLQGMTASGMEYASGLYQSLGGAQGVDALGQAFGRKLALNPSVTKYLDDVGIEEVKGGLSSTLAALGGQSLPLGSLDLYSVLKGKNLDQSALKGMTTALTDAGKELNLSSQQINGLNDIMNVVSKALLTG